MSRRSRRRRSLREGGVSPPSRPYTPTTPATPAYSFRAWRSYTPPVVPYRPPPASRLRRLEHPARPARRTVRPLIRTVLTDTLSPRRGTRTHLDAMRRAVLRSRSPSPWRTDDNNLFRFDSPPPLPRAMICAKRSIRREVLFALSRTSSGAGALRRKWTPDSNVRC